MQGKFPILSSDFSTYRMWGMHETSDDLNQPLTEQGCLRIAHRLVRSYENILTTEDLKECLLGGHD